MKSIGYRLCVFAVALLSLFVAIHSGRASVAHLKFFRVRYGDSYTELSDIIRECEQAHELYAHNYHFSRRCASKALAEAVEEPAGEHRESLIQSARSWCAFGLQQNPYDRAMKLCAVGLLEDEGDRTAAMELWEEHVQWQYWDHYNHSVLAILAARCGDFDKAEVSLGLIEGSKYYATTKASVIQARRQSLFAVPWGK
jgi:hypothetical protein